LCLRAGWIFLNLFSCFEKLHLSVQLFSRYRVVVKGREVMEDKTMAKSLKKRIRSGRISRADVTRRLAELAFGRANDCVKLALEEDPKLERLDLSLLSEIKRSEKGTVEIKLIDRLKALEQLTLAAGKDDSGAEAFLQALQQEAGEAP
jgi:hypothetical protein